MQHAFGKLVRGVEDALVFSQALQKATPATKSIFFCSIIPIELIVEAGFQSPD